MLCSATTTVPNFELRIYLQTRIDSNTQDRPYTFEIYFLSKIRFIINLQINSGKSYFIKRYWYKDVASRIYNYKQVIHNFKLCCLSEKDIIEKNLKKQSVLWFPEIIHTHTYTYNLKLFINEFCLCIKDVLLEQKIQT